MKPTKRIRVSLLIEKMKEQKKYSEILGLEEVSLFHGKEIKKEEI
ncbi:MAG: hypothetical protein ACI4UH_05405 [Dorea sp.]